MIFSVSELLEEIAKRNLETKNPQKGQKGFQPIWDKSLSSIGSHGTNKQLAKEAKVSHETVRKVEILLQKADDTLKAKLETNKISIDGAFKK
jgi:predicted AAA+ superfamily ATPase